MAAAVGSAKKMNKLNGAASLISISQVDLESNLKDYVYPKNILIVFPDRSIRMTDGVTKLKDLKPVFDKVLTSLEKDALGKAFETGYYKPTEGGVLVFGEGVKIDDAVLNFVEDGKINPDYLSDFIDDDGIFRLDKLPSTVQAIMTVVADIEERDALEDDSEAKKSLVYVLDATGESDIDAGSALYVWKADASEWIRLAVYPDTDIDIEDVKVSEKSVEEVGAVLYSHKVFLGDLDIKTFTDKLQEAGWWDGWKDQESEDQDAAGEEVEP